MKKLALLSGILSLVVMVACERKTDDSYTMEEERKLKQQIADRQIEEFFGGEGFYDPIHSEEAYQDAIWGRRHRRIMDGEDPDG